MLPKDCTMSAKSFFNSYQLSVISYQLKRRLWYANNRQLPQKLVDHLLLTTKSYFLVLLIGMLSIVGCENSTSKGQIRYEWKTVMEGDWSSHLYDVHFVSETQGWAVGNAVDIIPGQDFTEDAESLIIHTNNGDKHGISKTVAFLVNRCVKSISDRH